MGSCDPTQGFGGNSLGIGAYCTQGGGQCGSNLFCAADANQPYNFCILLGCTANTDCAEDACCVAQQGLQVCVPVGCVPGNVCQ